MRSVARLAAVVLSASLAVPAMIIAQGPPPPPPGGYYGGGGWDAPPPEFTRDIQRQGFQDGLYGARKDLENRRRPDVRNRDEFRHYHGPERRVYRDAFARGYNAFWAHQGPRPY